MHPLHILVVDDDPVLVAWLRDAFARLGHRVASASGVAEARGLLALDRVDLVMCDLRLPDGDGASLATIGGRAVFVAMSANVDFALARRLRRAGFAESIEKPISLASLNALLRRQFGAARDGAVAEPPAATYPLRPGEARLLDDHAARIACGSDEVVLALRRLLADELRRTRVHIRQALRTNRPAVAREALHKLGASCALVGAARLRVATVGLMRAIDEGAVDRKLVIAFDRCAGRTWTALSISAPPARTSATR